jgi:uncharacterized membrane protein YkoI
VRIMSQTIIKKVGLGIIAIVVLSVIIWQLMKSITFAEPLTQEDAMSKVQNMYKAEIVKVEQQQNKYVMTIKVQSGTYEIVINRETGEVGNLKQIKNETVSGNKVVDKQTNPPSPTTETPPTTQSPDEPVRTITEEEAVAIALQNISGTVDGIKTNQSNGVTYYLIEVERTDGEEGTVQINGITGEVISITWDD